MQARKIEEMANRSNHLTPKEKWLLFGTLAGQCSPQEMETILEDATVAFEKDAQDAARASQAREGMSIFALVDTPEWRKNNALLSISPSPWEYPRRNGLRTNGPQKGHGKNFGFVFEC